MTYRNRMEAGYLLNNANVLNKIILDHITHHGASDLHYRLATIGDSDHVLVRARYESSCPRNIELMQQMQNLQSVIDLLMELRR